MCVNTYPEKPLLLTTGVRKYSSLPVHLDNQQKQVFTNEVGSIGQPYVGCWTTFNLASDSF